MRATATRTQDYPTRTITLVVPYPPGGGVDALARIVAEKLSGALGQQVVVDNRAGGSGLVGTRAVIKSAPDGYTLFLGHTGSISINPILYANAGFDPRKDFAPIGLIASMPVALLAHPSFPAKTIADVIAIAKKEGGKFNIGTSAVGTGGYLSAELFKSITGVEAAIIPYKGTGAGDERPARRPCAGRVRRAAAGARQSAGRHAARDRGDQPDRASACCRTCRPPHESGLPGFESVLHYGLLAPAGTPRPIIDRLNKELRALVDTDEVKQRIQTEGGDPLTSTPDEYAKDIDSEERKWGDADQEAQSEGRLIRRAMPAIANRVAALLVAALLRMRRAAAAAQSFPTRPVTLIVPFPPGGGNDALARAVAERMSRTLGQQVVVDNRGGAGGTVATRAVAKAAPDGYTILLAYTGTLAINPSLYPNVGYDPRKDFAPIGVDRPAVERAGGAPLAAGPFGRRADRVRQGQPAQDRLRLRARHGRPHHHRAVRQDRGASTSPASPTRATAPAMADLVGGHVSMMFLSILPVLGHVRGGTLRALAVTNPSARSCCPTCRPSAESGLPGFSAAIRYGLVAPAGTPRADRRSAERGAAGRARGR